MKKVWLLVLALSSFTSNPLCASPHERWDTWEKEFRRACRQHLPDTGAFRALHKRVMEEGRGDPRAQQLCAEILMLITMPPSTTDDASSGFRRRQDELYRRVFAKSPAAPNSDDLEPRCVELAERYGLVFIVDCLKIHLEHIKRGERFALRGDGGYTLSVPETIAPRFVGAALNAADVLPFYAQLRLTLQSEQHVVLFSTRIASHLFETSENAMQHGALITFLRKMQTSEAESIASAMDERVLTLCRTRPGYCPLATGFRTHP